MRMPWISLGIVLLLFPITSLPQAQTPDHLSVETKELPPASLWAVYGSKNGLGLAFSARGGIGPYHWRIITGMLPKGVKLQEDGEIMGAPDESGNFQFTVNVRDSSNPPAEAQQSVVLKVENPFSAEWERKAQVNGQRIDGSIEVSNRTGRDFDLTFVVLAVNDMGRATAIGYQHFPLKRQTRDMSLPFGDTLSWGNYIVHVDVVAEEPISNRIFRARLVTGKESIVQGP